MLIDGKNYIRVLVPKESSKKPKKCKYFTKGMKDEIKEEFRELNGGLFSVIDAKLNTEHQIEIKEYNHGNKNIQRNGSKFKKRKK